MSKFATPLISLAMGALGASMVTYVSLQPTTPGTKETGNINVSGTVISKKVLAGINSSASVITGYSADGGTTGVQGLAKNFGIRGQSIVTSGLAYGGYFDTSSTEGYGAWIKNKANNGPGTGLLAESAGPAGTAGDFRSTFSGPVYVSYALKASSSSSNGQSAGVFAECPSGYGVLGKCLSTGGYGIQGEGYVLGVNGISNNGSGVRGYSSLPNHYGVFGALAAGGTGHAVYADGTLGASGTKSLMIDYPDDPTNKYLYQYCAEGDTPQLQYRGLVKLDASGSATVELPSYFEKINRDPVYQLTAVGASMPNIYVSEKVKNNRFRIAGGKAGAEVSWLVIGIRNDRFVRKYGAATIREKPAEFRGTYLQPELYDQPRQLAQDYDVKALDYAQPSSKNPPKK